MFLRLVILVHRASAPAIRGPVQPAWPAETAARFLGSCPPSPSLLLRWPAPGAAAPGAGQRAGLVSIPSGSAALIRSSSIMSEPFHSGGGLVAVPRQPCHGLTTLFISSRGLGPHLAGLSPRETSACWPIICWRLSRRRTPCRRIRQLEAAQSIPVTVACLRAWRTWYTICARPPSCRPAWTGRRSPWARTCRDAGEGGLALEAYDLIEYKPVTHSVDVVRVVMIPSPVQQVHLLDLEPGQSVIRAKLERGRRVSVASWVNPDESHADAGFDAYVAGIVEVVETVTEITQTDAAHLLGSVRWRPAGPAGGGLPCRYRAATRDSHADDRNRSYRLRPGPATMAFLDRRTAGKAIERAGRAATSPPPNRHGRLP